MQALKTFIQSNAWLIGVIALSSILLYQLVDPAPPKSLTIATGDTEGRYYKLAQELKKDLAKQGIELNILATAGSSDNINLLLDPNSNATIALVQSGMEEFTHDENDILRSLGSLYYEPIWLFYRKDLNIQYLTDLKNKRIAIGKKGSGTQAIVQYVLSENGLSHKAGNVQFFNDDIETTIEQLRSGKIDAAFFTISPQSETIKTLLDLAELDFVDVTRSEAYTARYPFLSSVVISEGLLDLEKNIPDSDRTTLASTATLVVNDRFHPAHTPLILDALDRRLKKGGVLEKPHTFPSPDYAGFELTREADHFFEYGPPFLQRYMPFWAASLVDRLVIFVIPLLVIIIPLSKLAGPVYRWRIRSRIYKWYRYLLEMDRKITAGELQNPDEARGKLKDLANELGSIEVPLSYADELYQLKQHVEYIDRRIVNSQHASN